MTLDHYREHGSIIQRYLIYLMNNRYSFTPTNMSSSGWIELFLHEAFDEWKEGGLNFERWLNSANRQAFEAPFEQLILFNNRYFKQTRNINWIYQVRDFNPSTVINTYASIYAHTDPHDIIINTLVNNFRECNGETMTDEP